MIENKNIRIVKEDAVMGDKCTKTSISFRSGYNDFQYPLTVSFCNEGEYRVVIKGKTAEIEKIS